MSAYENLLTRRAIRLYTDEPVPQELVEKVATAGTFAPTGMGMQSPLIIAVTQKSMRDKLSAMNAAVLNQPDTDPFYGAPVVLVVLADRTKKTHLFDGALVMGNLMNAAHALGLGSCWIHRAREVFETDEGRAILRNLDISDDYVGIGLCILGYAAQELPEPAQRKIDYVHYIH